MPILKALREVRYASITYQAGETFEATDKDAKVLKAVRKATDAEAAPKTVDLPKEAMVMAEVEEDAAPLSGYLRRDMTVGQIGAEIPAQSSRRGRPRKVQTLESSGGEAE